MDAIQEAKDARDEAIMLVARSAQELSDAGTRETPSGAEVDSACLTDLRTALADWKKATEAYLRAVQETNK